MWPCKLFGACDGLLSVLELREGQEAWLRLFSPEGEETVTPTRLLGPSHTLASGDARPSGAVVKGGRWSLGKYEWDQANTMELPLYPTHVHPTPLLTA